MKRYKVTFSVDRDALATLLQATENTEGVNFIAAEPDATFVVDRKRVVRVAPKIRGNGQQRTRAEDLLLQELRERGALKTEEAEEFLEARGYKRTSASPTLSKLRKEHLASSLDGVMWSFVKTGATPELFAPNRS